MNDEALLARARAGDHEAFAALVAPLRDPIYHRAVRAVGDRDEAEDVTQEVMVRAFTRLHTFRGDARFSSWLYQVGSNCIRMHLRSRRRRHGARLDDHAREVEAASERRAPVPAPDRLAMDAQLAGALAEAIAQLPPMYGGILRLWVEDGMDLKQIHDESGLSIGAVKTRLHRARSQVRAHLEREFGAGALFAA